MSKCRRGRNGCLRSWRRQWDLSFFRRHRRRLPPPVPAEPPVMTPAPLPPLDPAPSASAASKKAVDKWDVKLGGHVQLDYVSWLRADERLRAPQAAGLL
ncbi:MAG UNVERIFIED_CONTAM: hypothetical protein LVR18_22450 [Planctomycetaceae bacterium]